MDTFKIIEPAALNQSAFSLIGKDWLLITAEKEGKVNTMTASWGGLGVLWGKNVAFIFIRPQRYTKEFVDSNDCFSLSVLGEPYRKTLNYLGSASGRNEDKIAKSNLTVLHEQQIPYFQEANTVLLCRKLYAQELQADCFLDKTCGQKHYPDKDYHTMYVGEILNIMVR